MTSNFFDANYATIEFKVSRLIDTIKDHPERRLKARKDFYIKYGFSKKSNYGFGKSEIDFLEWEIKRGVLDKKYNNHWWYNTNLKYIYLSTLASYYYENGQTDTSNLIPVQKWIDYFNAPSAITWYRAHNSTILFACDTYSSLIDKEPYHEQVFIQEVINRVLYMEKVVEGKCKYLGFIGRFIADPKFSVVDKLTKVKQLYPTAYPLHQSKLNFSITNLI
ncbi:hypothetical protein [Flammeovirga agarivorans]|uniref:Uncharacterized protein n=1 Tax=Flammeovirga agarivorans TaxID=2726742 RepID=A0A7X8SQ27_9BACT|nr:hypothetical protein [Flammeovirga agarivorans]NLR94287.1 hypothetical protein [Flammeovirga agarivorans]